MTLKDAVRTANLPVVVGALAGLTIISWLGMLAAHGMHSDRENLLVWAAMTFGMMTPSAVPMIVTYARVAPRIDEAISAGLSVLIFTAAYLVLWIAFAGAASTLQAGMQRYFSDRRPYGIRQPVAPGLPTRSLQNGLSRRLCCGPPPRRLLHRLLLAADASRLGGRHD
jgi:Predicted metal-binding integral membrane protein (DUF2182)